MKLDVLNQTGKSAGQVEVSDVMFGAPLNASLIAQAIRVRMANAHLGLANTKERDEVRGGGRKPWRQKGTGRARQGSIRAPQWRGGGIVHGPEARIIVRSMPKRMRRQALFSALSEKARQNQLVIVDDLKLSKAKTSDMQTIMAALPVGKTTLIVLPAKNEAIERSARNLADVRVITAPVLHAYDVTRPQTVVVVQGSLDVLTQTFLNATKKEAVATEAKPVKASATPAKAAAKPAAKTVAEKPTAKKTTPKAGA